MMTVAADDEFSGLDHGTCCGYEPIHPIFAYTDDM
jgi:hypothetical protein